MTRLTFCLLAAALALPMPSVGHSVNRTAGNQSPLTYASLTAHLKAIVIPADKLKGYEAYESRVEVRDKGGKLLAAYDFSSDDGSHGYGVASAQWTADSRYFVFSMTNSGGHSPMFAPVVFWSHATNHFYELKDYTADIVFTVSSPDKVTVSTWPGMQEVTLALHVIDSSQITELH